MKLLSIIIVLATTSNAFANADLQSAFQKAIQNSESDKKSSLTTITLDHDTRLAAWKKRKRQVVVVPSSGAVDMPYTVSREKTPASHIETDSYVTKELSNLE